MIEKIRNLEIARVYLILGILIGLAYVFFTPPFQTPDEVAHFYRTYSLVQGKLLVTDTPEGGGTEVPSSLPNTVRRLHEGVPFDYNSKVDKEAIIKSLNDPLYTGEDEFVDFYNTAVYTPFSYIPQMIGVGAGSVLGLSPLLLMYLGRVVNLLVGVILIYYAIKITPVFKKVFMALGLMPMTIFLFGSLSADVLVIGLSFLLIALILKYTTDKKVKINTKEIALLSGIILILGLSKQFYVLIPLLIYIIPVERFKNVYYKYGVMLLPLAAAVILNLIWASQSRVFYMGQDLISAQIDTYLHSPFSFIYEFFYEYIVHGWFIYEQFIGQLGWLDTRLPYIFVLIPFTLLLAILVMSEKLPRILTSLRTKLTLAFIVLGTIGAITLVVFIFWKSQTGGGVQGRYFIPIAPLALMILSFRDVNLELNIKNKRLYFYTYLIFVNIVSFIAIFLRYYT